MPILACGLLFAQRRITLKPFEYIIAAILGVLCLPIALWSYNHWMTVTGQGTYSPTTSITGSPSISAEQVDKVLCKASSPACGTGYTLYTYGTQHGIDPAFALAVFHHESNYGKEGVATQTRSLGNIRCTDGYTCIGGFRSYPSWQESYTDFYKLIAGPLYVGAGLDTPEKIMPRYAPAADSNNPVAYATAVTADMASWRQA